MKLHLNEHLPFISVVLSYQGQSLEIPHILIDTGSATSIFSADYVAQIGIFPSSQDILHTIRGVGGIEVVFRRTLESIRIGEFFLASCPVDVGGMDYGFDMNGILGMDILIRAGACIDLQHREIRFQQ